MAKCRDSGTGFLAAFADICSILEMHKLANRCMVPNKNVNVHPSNRFGSGLDVSNVHVLLNNIVSSGWVAEKVGQCVGFEVTNDNEVAFNEELVQAAEGFLAPVRRECAEVLSISSSHTVAVLRALEAGVRHGEEGSDGVVHSNGHLSMEKVRNVCPSIEAPIRSGLSWLKIRREVAIEIPSLPDFLSEAANSGQNTAQEHTKTQVLLQIHQKGMAMKRLHGDFKWELVTKTIESNCVSLRGEVQSMTDFVAAYSGGDKPRFLYELDAFAKSSPYRKDIAPTLLGKLGKVPLAQAPEYIISCVMALFSSPGEHSDRGVSTLLTAADVSSLGDKNKAAAVESAKLVRSALAWCGTAGVTQRGIAKIGGSMRVRLVYLLHNKTLKKKKQFKSRQEVMEQFIHDVVTAQPELSAIQAPWKAVDHLATLTGTTVSQVGPMRDFKGGSVGTETLTEMDSRSEDG